MTQTLLNGFILEEQHNEFTLYIYNMVLGFKYKINQMVATLFRKMTQERVARLEQQVSDLKETNGLEHQQLNTKLDRIDCKLDTAIKDKVDKNEFTIWRNWILGIIASILVLLISIVLK